MKPSFEKYLREEGLDEEVLAQFRAGKAIAVESDAFASWLEAAWKRGAQSERRKISKKLLPKLDYLDGFIAGRKGMRPK